MSRLDLNGDGFIDVEEFGQAWTIITGTTRSDRIKQLETLPLGKYCDSIQQELLYMWRVKQVYWQDRRRYADMLRPLFADLSTYATNPPAEAPLPISPPSTTPDVSPPRLPPQAMQGTQTEAGKQAVGLADAEKVFQGIDADGSGEITEKELWGVLKGSFTEEQCAEAFNDMDLNKDGVIDLDEFRHAWTVSDVVAWLQSVGLEEYSAAFSSNDVDGEVLLGLTNQVPLAFTNQDLLSMGVSSVGKRKSILKQVQLLRESVQKDEAAGRMKKAFKRFLGGSARGSQKPRPGKEGGGGWGNGAGWL